MRQVDLAGKKVRAAIEALEPYPNGQYKLHELNEADVHDKHRLLTAVGRAVPIIADQLGLIEPALRDRIHGPGMLHFVGEGDDILRLTLAKNDARHLGGAYEKTAVVQPAFVLHFDAGTSLALAPVIPMLLKLVDSVSYAVGSLETAAA